MSKWSWVSLAATLVVILLTQSWVIEYFGHYKWLWLIFIVAALAVSAYAFYKLNSITRELKK